MSSQSSGFKTTSLTATRSVRCTTDVVHAVVPDMMDRILFIGDSDIAFWPHELLPDVNTGKSSRNNTPSIVTTVQGYSGATLADVADRLRDFLHDMAGSVKDKSARIVIVACAGENDIGNNIPLDTTLTSLRLFLDILFGTGDYRVDTPKTTGTDTGTGTTQATTITITKLVFLGPKFEPWLEDDPSYKKKYTKMSRSFQRCLVSHPQSERIDYVDCLTMFCGETAGVPGATLAGRACAQENYFSSDGLHLSFEGYKIWKGQVEARLEKLYTVHTDTTTDTDSKTT